MRPTYLAYPFCLALLVLFGCSPEKASRIAVPAISAPPVVSDETRRLVRMLTHGTEAEWREAQLRLGSHGADALAALDDPAIVDSPLLRPRLPRLLSKALLTSVTFEELQAHPALYAVVRDDIEQGLALARDFPDLGPGLESFLTYTGSVVAPPHVQRYRAIFALGGFGVPGMLTLLKKPSPAVRVLAAELLTVSRAVPALDAVRDLQDDPAEVDLSDGRCGRSSTVGGEVRTALSNYERHVPVHVVMARDILASLPPSFPEYATWSDLDAALREIPAVTRATSEESWWAAARPVWALWWQLSPDGTRMPRRDHWKRSVVSLSR
jgi:hypothetical protein